ncbi:hypothetical protein PPACK8108_LOCUS14132 [Phakopsora pachyrhizi]|uniref:Uncharacterized protein n=1 Tax=Phakopsora pachyrhizi TaxID=170000 RepID=A0AAV0B4F0_PHAPC|nr:hypothetical protein PPACK8108_LOCUS14132 [Phakopsora pachyrhizi]
MLAISEAIAHGRRPQGKGRGGREGGRGRERRERGRPLPALPAPSSPLPPPFSRSPSSSLPHLPMARRLRQPPILLASPDDCKQSVSELS